MGCFLVPVQTNIDIIFKWDANIEEDLAGYKLYYSTVSGTNNMVLLVDVGNVTTYTVNLINQRYFFSLKAYDLDNLLSDFSNVVSYIP